MVKKSRDGYVRAISEFFSLRQMLFVEVVALSCASLFTLESFLDEQL